MRILLIDTCTERGVIAYGNHQHLLFAKDLPFGLNQSKCLLPYLAEVVQLFGRPLPLDVIGVGIGPGSYTGIRVGVAVAQALAYSWKTPLVGVSSLSGFVPLEYVKPFAAIFDARIGGVYFQKGSYEQQELIYQGNPQMSSWEEIGQYLNGVTHLVTPVAKSLQAKFDLHYPDHHWTWEERAPSLSVLMQNIERQYLQNKLMIPPGHIDLLYLRETEAERNLEIKNKEKKASS